MKQILMIFGYILVLMALLGLGQSTYTAGGKAKVVQAQKTFAKAGQTDTSSTYSLEYYEKVVLQTAIYGTDSVMVIVNTDGYGVGKWELNLNRDTLIISETSLTTLVKDNLLRGYSTTTLAGYEQVRFRTVIGAVGADDSTSALYYKQTLFLKD